jgi:hypothetical protein
MSANLTIFDTGTVSGTVSKKSENTVVNCGELARITIEFTGKFAIFPLLNRALQVATRRPYLVVVGSSFRRFAQRDSKPRLNRRAQQANMTVRL